MERGLNARPGRTLILALVGTITAGALATAQDLGIPAVPGAGSAIPGAGAAIPGAGAAIPGAGAAIPDAASVAAIPAAGAIPGAATAALPAAPRTIWGFFGLNRAGLAGAHATIADCKAKFCASQIGSLVNSGMMPLSALSGGLIGPCCPTVPTAAQLAAAEAQGGAEGVAAKIKAEEAQAKAKIAAIEYLATVDCRYWPDAEAVLVERLRADRNECVRYAAARAMGTGCCCTKKTIAALKLVVEGADTDGNPSERSERVRSASWYALSHCVGRYVPPAPRPGERPTGPRREYPGGPAADPRAAAAFWDAVDDTPGALIVADARRVLTASRTAPLGDQTLPTGSRSLFHSLAKAASPPRHEPVKAPEGGPEAVVIRTTAPPFFPAPPPPYVSPAPAPGPPTAITAAPPDRSVRRTGAEASPIVPARRPAKSLLELFSTSRRAAPGA